MLPSLTALLPPVPNRNSSSQLFTGAKRRWVLLSLEERKHHTVSAKSEQGGCFAASKRGRTRAYRHSSSKVHKVGWCFSTSKCRSSPMSTRFKERARQVQFKHRNAEAQKRTDVVLRVESSFLRGFFGPPVVSLFLCRSTNCFLGGCGHVITAPKLLTCIIEWHFVRMLLPFWVRRAPRQFGINLTISEAAQYQTKRKQA